MGIQSLEADSQVTIQARQAHRNDELVSSTVDLHQERRHPETTVQRC